MSYVGGDLVPFVIDKDSAMVAPTVALREVGTGNYLDFADNVLKASGWTTQSLTLVDRGEAWEATWDSTGFTAAKTFVVEWTLDGGVYPIEMGMNMVPASSGGGGTTLYPTSITYNVDGTINVVTWDDGTTWTHNYNSSGQLTSVTKA